MCVREREREREREVPRAAVQMAMKWTLVHKLNYRRFTHPEKFMKYLTNEKAFIHFNVLPPIP